MISAPDWIWWIYYIYSQNWGLAGLCSVSSLDFSSYNFYWFYYWPTAWFAHFILFSFVNLLFHKSLWLTITVAHRWSWYTRNDIPLLCLMVFLIFVLFDSWIIKSLDELNAAYRLLRYFVALIREFVAVAAATAVYFVFSI